MLALVVVLAVLCGVFGTTLTMCILFLYCHKLPQWVVPDTLIESFRGGERRGDAEATMKNGNQTTQMTTPQPTVKTISKASFYWNRRRTGPLYSEAESDIESKATAPNLDAIPPELENKKDKKSGTEFGLTGFFKQLGWKKSKVTVNRSSSCYDDYDEERDVESNVMSKYDGGESRGDLEWPEVEEFQDIQLNDKEESSKKKSQGSLKTDWRWPISRLQVIEQKETHRRYESNGTTRALYPRNSQETRRVNEGEIQMETDSNHDNDNGDDFDYEAMTVTMTRSSTTDSNTAFSTNSNTNSTTVDSESRLSKILSN